MDSTDNITERATPVLVAVASDSSATTSLTGPFQRLHRWTSSWTHMQDTEQQCHGEGTYFEAIEDSPAQNSEQRSWIFWRHLWSPAKSHNSPFPDLCPITIV